MKRPIAFASMLLAAHIAAVSLAAENAGSAQTTPQSVPMPSTAPVPAGAYKLDKSHATLLMRVDHLGFSRYVARFARFDAQLQFDPAKPGAASVTVTIDPRSISADGAPEGFMETLAGEQWLDAGKYPQITYRSTKVRSTGKGELHIDGELTLHGVTRPVALVATYNGGYAGHPFDPQARIGFSAKGVLKRSQFGIAYGIPEPGSDFGVGDDVEVMIEAEFSGPPMPAAATSK